MINIYKEEIAEIVTITSPRHADGSPAVYNIVIKPESASCNLENSSTPSCLVVVLVAEGRAALGVLDLADGGVGEEAEEADGRVVGAGRDGADGGVGPADGIGAPHGVDVLPGREVAVGKGVVHVKDGVGGGGPHVAHDGADTLVSVGVHALLLSHGHLPKVRVRVAEVAVGLAGQRGLGLVEGARQAVRGGDALGRADADGDVGKGAVLDARGKLLAVLDHHLGGRPVVLGREDGRVGKVARVLGLVPPGQRQVARVAALVAERLLVVPEEQAVPHVEVADGVDVLHQLLVDVGKVLGQVLGAGVAHPRRQVVQAAGRLDPLEPVLVREVAPLHAHLGVLASAFGLHLVVLLLVPLAVAPLDGRLGGLGRLEVLGRQGPRLILGQDLLWLVAGAGGLEGSQINKLGLGADLLGGSLGHRRRGGGQGGAENEGQGETHFDVCLVFNCRLT